MVFVEEKNNLYKPDLSYKEVFEGQSVEEVSEIRQLHHKPDLRRQVMRNNGWSFRDLYRTLELPGANPLKTAYDVLAAAVRAAYGMGPKEDPLAFLLALHGELAVRLADGQLVVGPCLPPSVEDAQHFVTTDRIASEGWRES